MSPAVRGPGDPLASEPRSVIRRSTRKNLLDWMSAEGTAWSGRLEEPQFLARIFDLDQMPSTDGRYETAAGDIWQHRVNNDDGTSDWVFTDSRFNLLGCPDETFLLFVTEVLHPVVRPDQGEAKRLAETFNDLLLGDGYELVAPTKVAGKPVWAARRRSLHGTTALPALRVAREKFDADYILRQITRMETSVEDDPGLAIGTAKELARDDLQGHPGTPWKASIWQGGPSQTRTSRDRRARPRAGGFQWQRPS